jgi:ATP-dependent Zn protease
VATRWKQIEAVAQMLMDRETLDESECRQVLESVLE